MIKKMGFKISSSVFATTIANFSPQTLNRTSSRTQREILIHPIQYTGFLKFLLMVLKPFQTHSICRGDH